MLVRLPDHPVSNPNLPSDAEYKAFDDYLHISGIIDDRVALKKAVKEKWETKDAFFGYFDWADREFEKDYIQEEPQRQTPPNEIIQLLDKMNYNSSEDHRKFSDAVSCPKTPCFYVGNDTNGDTYRITINSHRLLPDRLYPKPDHELLHPSILGVNTNTRLQRPDYFGEETFVFFQVGILEIWFGEPEDWQVFEETGEGPWETSGFSVVMRFGTNGTPRGVYLIYDAYPDDYPHGRPCPPIKITEGLWGYLGELKEQFSIAKIADKMSDLQQGRTFHLTKMYPYPVELVRIFQTRNGSILPVTAKNS